MLRQKNKQVFRVEPVLYGLVVDEAMGEILLSRAYLVLAFKDEDSIFT